MRDILEIMFKAWILREESHIPSSDPDFMGSYSKAVDDCYIEAEGGNDVNKAFLISCMDYWGNDIISMAPHFGIAYCRDINGKPFIDYNPPPCPDEGYWWSFEDQAWQKPYDEEKDEIAA